MKAYCALAMEGRLWHTDPILPEGFPQRLVDALSRAARNHLRKEGEIDGFMLANRRRGWPDQGVGSIAANRLSKATETSLIG